MMPLDILNGVLALASTLITVPALVVFAQLTVATFRRDVPIPATTSAPRVPRLAVLMPAHNEALGIEAAVRAVLAQCGPGDRLLVVADNCSDATARVARAAGAEVVERHDDQRRGKGYALDFGVRWIERAPPDVLVIVDADCIVAPMALGRLADTCLARARPVQALYLMHAPPGARLGMRISEFAWVIKNKVRPLGSARLGWPCQLMGTGMAFPWVVIQAAPLATGHLVEDMQLGLDLAGAGTAPLFCETALVSSVFPTDAEGARSQRTRWEHGHLSVIASLGPKLLWRALSRGNVALLGMVLDLMVPPLASLVLMLAAMMLIDATWWSLAGHVVPLVIAASAFALLVVGVAGAWRREGRRIIAASELLGLPLYVLGKIPVYVRLFTKRQVEWVRTKRHDRDL